MVRDALMPLARVGGRQPQRRDRPAAEHGGRVHRLARGDPGEPPPGAGAGVARPLRHDGHVGAGHVPRREQAGVHGHRLQVTAERLAGGDRRGQPSGRAQPGCRAGEPRGQRPAVLHDVDHSRRLGQYAFGHCPFGIGDEGQRARRAELSAGRPPPRASRPRTRRRAARRDGATPARPRCPPPPAAANSGTSRCARAGQCRAAAGRGWPPRARTRPCRARDQARSCSAAPGRRHAATRRGPDRPAHGTARRPRLP